MAKYGSPAVIITVDDGGGTPVILTQFVLEIGGVKITANTEPSTAFGDGWEENLPTGVRKVEELTISGFLDDVTQHPALKDVDGDVADTLRTFVVDFGGAAGTNVVLTFEALLTSYEVAAAVNGVTRYTATFLPSGSAVWS